MESLDAERPRLRTSQTMSRTDEPWISAVLVLRTQLDRWHRNGTHKPFARRRPLRGRFLSSFNRDVV